MYIIRSTNYRYYTGRKPLWNPDIEMARSFSIDTLPETIVAIGYESVCRLLTRVGRDYFFGGEHASLRRREQLLRATAIPVPDGVTLRQDTIA